MLDVLVVPLADRWVVQREREAVPFARFEVLKDAVAYGRMLADACGSALVIAVDEGAPPQSPDEPGPDRRADASMTPPITSSARSASRRL